jgi:hypothetical protein
LPKFDPASADTKRFNDALRSSLADELILEYAVRLQQDIGVKVNEAALNQAIGNSGNN